MAYEVIMPYHLHMPSYFLETFTEYPFLKFFIYKILGFYLTTTVMPSTEPKNKR